MQLYITFSQKGDPRMTGRDLILYILENHLEDEQVFEEGNLLGFITIIEAAEKM